MLADEGTFEEWDKVMSISNPLSYKGYEEKVKKASGKDKPGRSNCHRKGKNRRNICSAWSV